MIRNTKDHVKALVERAKVQGRPADDLLHEDLRRTSEMEEVAEKATGRPVNILRHTATIESREDLERLIEAFNELGYDTEGLVRLRELMP